MGHGVVAVTARQAWRPTHGLRAYVGANGSGKTMVAVEECVIPALMAGFWAAANVTLNVEPLGIAEGERTLLLDSWTQIPRLGVQHGDPGRSLTNNQPCVLLLDEALACLPARSWSSTPAELLRTMDQFRKADVLVAITAPAFSKIERSLRSNIQTVTLCRGYSPDCWLRDQTRPRSQPPASWVRPGYPVLRDPSGVKQPFRGLWQPNRKFLATTYDAASFEDFTSNVVNRVEPLGERVWDRRRGLAQDVIATREQVQLLDHVDQGQCAGCGREVRERKRYCNCEAGAHEDTAGPRVRTPRPVGLAGVA